MDKDHSYILVYIVYRMFGSKNKRK